MNKSTKYFLYAFNAILILILVLIAARFFIVSYQWFQIDDGEKERGAKLSNISNGKSPSKTLGDFSDRRLLVVLLSDAFVYGAAPLYHFVGGLSAGSSLWVCGKNSDFIKLCDLEGLPPLYLKPDSKVRIVRAARYPQALIVNATSDYIDIVFDTPQAPAAFVQDATEKNMVNIHFLYGEKNVKFVKQYANIPYEIFVETTGRDSFKVQIKKESHCGVRVKRIRHFVSRIELKNCRKNATPVIALDPGHGGNEKGTCSDQLCEKDLSLAFTKTLDKVLRDAGYSTVLLRNSDKVVSLEDRLQKASHEKVDLLLSLHFDHWVYSETLQELIVGTSCYYYYNFLREPADRICDNTSLYNGNPASNRIKRSLYMISSHEFPSVLVELANFASKKDLKMIQNGFDNAGVAEKIRERLDRYFRKDGSPLN